MEEIILDIAQKYFNVETLQTRHLDRLDFHEVSVISMKEALQAAYKAGMEEAKKNNK